MRFLLICSFIFGFLFAEDYKQSIAECQRDLECVDTNRRGELFLKLAILHYKDQEHELAFKTFFKALDSNPEKAESILPAADQNLYEEALRIYLNQSSTNIHENAKLILERYSILFEKNQDNYGLGFLISASYANLHHFEDFFVCFYRSYQQSQNHYLAHKIKAILYLKLFEMARTLQERESLRNKIENHAEIALKIYPADSSLHKLIIQFAAKKNIQVEKLLQKIIQGETSIARSDILFYVQKAIEAKKFELAQQFIDKMHKQYHYSRVLSSAQYYLDEAKGIEDYGN